MVFTCSKKEQGLAEGGGVDGSGEKIGRASCRERV